MEKTIALMMSRTVVCYVLFSLYIELVFVLEDEVLTVTKQVRLRMQWSWIQTLAGVIM